MNKKKIIWTLLAVTVTGLAAYSTFIHQPEHSKFGCLFCSLRSSGMVWFAAGIAVAGATYTYLSKE